ncbi:unnamed protein product [Chondrus crispus]|uniref:Uncharacterized protein n=1 Tax=Chondrus crispus TaxID=2769 RepID=R7QCH9_CHOCR|nr:unnamed protein product [Chondrus crispus]CDF35779.1 unnamed protein product [Chondrus crispus]|eukprot:XP_005715598.1 unnamed protein product [Chondrus crispus]
MSEAMQTLPHKFSSKITSTPARYLLEMTSPTSIPSHSHLASPTLLPRSLLPLPSPGQRQPPPHRIMFAFTTPTALSVSNFHPSPRRTTSPRRAHHATPRMSTYRYSPTVDEFFARDVTRQYIAKACPTGEPPLQCIEGNTFDAPYESRTLKRQAQLRYRQLPTAVKVHNMYETRREALIACHGCSHEEARVLNNPMMATAMIVGQAESTRACSRYIRAAGKDEDVMVRSVENVYMKAVNPGGVFSTACTDGQAKYEAYLSQVRGKAAEFRSRQYSKAAKAGAAYAARKRATARTHICVYEDGLYNKYPKMAGSMRPSFGYYAPFVSRPSDGTQARVGGIAKDPGYVFAVEKLGKMLSSAKN